MYSKTRGGTPNRYRLSEEDFMVLDFPIADDDQRKKKSSEFEKSLTKYDREVKKAERELIKSHTDIEIEL